MIGVVNVYVKCRQINTNFTFSQISYACKMLVISYLTRAMKEKEKTLHVNDEDCRIKSKVVGKTTCCFYK